ncbi:MAG: hypothetical protein CMJ64_09890 [Planctomycetaceae bacterium]|nr:hypothetical protein [Planctomycetaceae bacterium]
MNRERAIKLLEMLRRRTEARGATPAEAAQAVELAERLMKRYGIEVRDVESESKATSSMEMQTKVCPWWARLIIFGIERRFKLKDTAYRRRTGRNAVVSFVGAEHIASVAAWLFRAIVNDIVTRAEKQARRVGVRGSSLIKFRTSASLELLDRLNPRTEQQRIAAAELAEEQRESQCSRKVKPLSPEELLAIVGGAEAGRDVSIAANAVGGDRTALLSHARLGRIRSGT